MNRNYTIDLFRLIASFFILTLHTELPDFNIELSSYIRLAGRWAVPFFFMTTGYFIGRKIKDQNTLAFTSIQKNFVNLVSIFVVGSLVFFAWTWSIGELWFFNDISLFFWGGYWHLWFISAMILAYLVIWYFYAINQSKLLPILSAAILIIGLYSDSYDVVFNSEIVYDSIPRFLSAIPFMYLGIYLYNKKIKPNQLQLWIVVFGMGFILQYLEMWFLNKEYDYPMYDHQILIGTIISSVAIFMMCLLITTKETKLAIYGKKYSLFIYLYHLIAFWSITKILALINIELSDYIQLAMPILGFIVTLLFAILLDKYIPKLFMVLNGSLGTQKTKN